MAVAFSDAKGYAKLVIGKPHDASVERLSHACLVASAEVSVAMSGWVTVCEAISWPAAAIASRFARV